MIRRAFLALLAGSTLAARTWGALARIRAPFTAKRPQRIVQLGRGEYYYD